MRRITAPLAAALALALTSAATAYSPLAQVTAREQQRQDRFAALTGVQEREVYSGQALGKQVYVNSFGSTVTGQGPAGQLTLFYTGSSVSGSSGGRPVNLSMFGGSVSGFGARGYVSLSAFGNSIMGRAGDLNVNVTVMGGFASGFVGNQPFQLSGFSNLNPMALAALIGAL